MKNILYILVLSTFTLVSQNTWQPCEKAELINAYSKICNWLIQTKSYSFNLRYTSYKNHLTRDLEESSKGYYKRNENNFKCEAMGVLNFQNNNVKVTVDSADKVISISDPSSLNFTIMEYSELEKLLTNVKAIRKKTVGKGTVYRIDFSKNELIEAYEFKVNGQGLLEQSVYYYAEQIEKEYPDEAGQPIKEIRLKPRLEVDFSDYKYPVRFADSEFSETAFVSSETNKLSPAAKFKTYRVVDYRLKTKK